MTAVLTRTVLQYFDLENRCFCFGCVRENWHVITVLHKYPNVNLQVKRTAAVALLTLTW